MFDHAAQCWWCGHPNDAATVLEGEGGPAPKDGDCLICLNCAEPGVFTKDGQVREPTIDESIAFGKDERVQKMLGLVRRFQKEKGAPKAHD